MVAHDKYYVKNEEKPHYVKKEKKYLLLSLKTDNKKKTDSKKIRGVTLINEIATQRSLCTHCSSKKSTF